MKMYKTWIVLCTVVLSAIPFAIACDNYNDWDDPNGHFGCSLTCDTGEGYVAYNWYAQSCDGGVQGPPSTVLICSNNQQGCIWEILNPYPE